MSEIIVNLKRKFTLHLDALIVIGFLFICSIGFNFVQLQQVKSLSQDVIRLESKVLVHELNLSSQQQYIDKLKRKYEAESTQ
ncbi:MULTISPECIES: hypothetical protein [Neptuniibacter]|jgi:hypothetical protein|uniref:hypothetical protein n=1 Tax=Neptuniibacter TaxID=459520 RepID=UPI00082E22EC|nr:MULTISPECIES: hypothetical protein [Neptuniibacter]|tara:strand:- start:2155 stop:2400 length:246 start_codon:yes stop_codon:yes gene_type:complete